MQDQAFLGPESALAVPAADGGIDLYIATQWLHVDQGQVAASLGLPLEQTRLHLAGVGGRVRRARGPVDAGARRDARAAHRPPGEDGRTRARSRSSATCTATRRGWSTSTAPRATAACVYVDARIVLDGGAYASSSTAVVANAATFACGPYDVPSARIDGRRRLHEQPALRGDARLRRRPGRVRPRVADGPAGRRARHRPRGAPDPQRPRSRACASPRARSWTARPRCARCWRSCARCRCRPWRAALPMDLRELPGGVSNTTHGEGTRRGVGLRGGLQEHRLRRGVRRLLHRPRAPGRSTTGGPVAEVQTAAAEVGQGLVTVLEQIARTELDVERRGRAARPTRRVGSAGSTSASRQTWMTGGAVRLACERCAHAAARAAPGDEARRSSAPARRPGRGDRRLPPPAHPAARPRDRPGRLAGGARLRGPPRRVRRRRGARPGARGRDRHHPGRRPGR